MKALTILQPWASLIALGHKRIETRGWRTDYRGPIAIHAGKSCEYAFLLQREPFSRYRLSDLPLGAIVAKAHLVQCLPILVIPSLPACLTAERGRVLMWSGTNQPRDDFAMHELAFGDYSTHCRWGWVLENVQRLPDPTPARGAQGLWEWAESVTEVGR